MHTRGTLKTPTFSKRVIQDWLRAHPWGLHVVLESEVVQPTSDACILNRLKKANYLLCKRFLHRRFSKRPLEQRFHYIAFFQGHRDAGTRHVHVLVHIPQCVRPANSIQQFKLRSAVQTAWLAASDKVYFPWVRAIKDVADSCGAATYVSRYCSFAYFTGGDIQFSA